MTPGVLCDGVDSLGSCAPSHVRAPPSTADCLAWDGTHLEEADYSYRLTSSDIEDIDKALLVFKSFELDGPDIGRENFPLGKFGRRLEGFSREVHNGRGFVILSGLDPDRYSVEDSALAFLGISSYIGSERGMQDNRGRMMVHIRDRGNGPSEGTKGSNKSSPFHTEFFCDILALYVKSEPASGGNMKIASSQQVYNDLCRMRPDIIDALLKPNWTFESRGKLFPGHTRPLLFLKNNAAILNFSRRPLLGPCREDGKPGTGNLSRRQHEALLAIQDAASRCCLNLPSRKGNLLFVNNLAMLHSRDGFTDDEYSSRHLLRLWLRNPELAWPLPGDLAPGHERIYGENGRMERWELMPAEAEGKRVKKRSPRDSPRNGRSRGEGDGESSNEETSGEETSGSETTGTSSSH